MQSVSNTLAARAVILVPIIGWLLLNENFTALFAKLSNSLDPQPNPVPWRLFATYFGLCFVGAASFLYQAFCPSVIKRYPGNTDYVAAMATQMSSLELSRVGEALLKGDARSRALHKMTQELAAMPALGDQNARHESMRRDTLTAHFDLCNRAWYPVRVAAAVFYVVGLLVIAVPSADVFVRVACRLFRTAFGS